MAAVHDIGQAGQRRPGRAAPHLRPAAAVRPGVESDLSRGGESGDMLMKALSRVALVLAAAVAVTGLWQGPASATGGPGGGGFGGTTMRPELHAGLQGHGRQPRKPRRPGQSRRGRDRRHSHRRQRPGVGLHGHGERDVRLRPGRLHDHGPDTGLPDRGWRRRPAAGVLRRPRRRGCWPGSPCGTCGFLIR